MRFKVSTDAFLHSLDRSDGLVALYQLYSDEANADILRASWIQAVSALDYFVHELILVETRYRCENAYPTRRIHVPMDTHAVSNPPDRIEAILTHVRIQNSYRAFVAPDRLAEALASYCETPWNHILTHYRNTFDAGAKQEDLKKNLRFVWQRRNKIVHEADIQPGLGGVRLWPLYEEDTIWAIDFIRQVGLCLPPVIAIPL